MKTKKREAFRVVGIDTRTINSPGKAEIDIPALWNRFMTEAPGNQLPEKISEEFLCVYCEYEGDHSQHYTTLIGYIVPNHVTTPKGMKSITIPESEYHVFNAEGDLTKTAVIDAWHQIWQTELPRTYIADFEVYGEASMNPKDGKIDIFVGTTL